LPSLTEIGAIAVVVVFFVLTIVCQIDGRWAEALRHRDMFGMFPGWNFFAPRPGCMDFHLLYRDELPGGQVTAWREIPLAEERRWHDWLWNPERRLKKVVFDAFSSLTQVVKLEADVRLSIAYLVLLTYVTGYPRLYIFERTQFLLMMSVPTEPNREPMDVVLSDRHGR
jgi:hypothetical protein